MSPADKLLRRIEELQLHVSLSGDYCALRTEVLEKLRFMLEEHEAGWEDVHRAEEHERAERESELPWGAPW